MDRKIYLISDPETTFGIQIHIHILTQFIYSFKLFIGNVYCYDGSSEYAIASAQANYFDIEQLLLGFGFEFSKCKSKLQFLSNEVLKFSHF